LIQVTTVYCWQKVFLARRQNNIRIRKHEHFCKTSLAFSQLNRFPLISKQTISIQFTKHWRAKLELFKVRRNFGSLDCSMLPEGKLNAQLGSKW
jgi:hypothetical protein